MTTLAEALRYLIQTAVSLYLILVLLRLLLQVSRADFYNPVSQFIVRATSPVLLPLRRAIPAIGRIDTAGWVLVLLLQCAGIVATLLLLGAGFVNPLQLLVWAVLGIAALVVKMYFWAVLAVIIMSFLAQGAYHPALALLHQFTDPVMNPFRRLLPPLGMFDFSPILLFITINVLNILLTGLARSAGLPAGIVVGF